jgi:hypothetical protein
MGEKEMVSGRGRWKSGRSGRPSGRLGGERGRLGTTRAFIHSALSWHGMLRQSMPR